LESPLAELFHALHNKNMKNLITPEKAASFIPVIVSSGISILLIIFFVIPQYFKSAEVKTELNSLIKKKNELKNLKSQYKIINRKFDKLKNEKLKIKELITGTSNLETLLAELGALGRKNNIEFLSIVPKKVVTKVENSNDKKLKKKNNQVDFKTDPLLVEGIKKYLIDFTFTTDFVNLLSFLRDLEYQDNIILLNDINLSLNRKENDKGEIDESRNIIEINMGISFYGKI
tara:strand:+ start:63 stop:755 length:693 start_codon:yes stop_codon:yes gene_type:complete